MNKISKPLLILFLAAIAIFFFFYGRYIPFHEQWPLYEALRTTASIIFGVMGAWIALIYPDTLAKILSKKHTNKTAEIQKVKRVLEPLVFSTFCVILVLTIGVFVPVLKQFSWIMEYVQIFRGISFGLLGMLTLAMGIELLKMLIPGLEIKQEFTAIKNKQEQLSKIQSRVQKQKSDE